MYEAQKQVMSEGKTPSRLHGKKKPARDADAAAPDADEVAADTGEGGAAKKTKLAGENDLRDHCLPYDLEHKMQFNRQLVPVEAQKYYEIVGKCQCLFRGKKCDNTRMTRNKFVPWTRFPTANGQFFCVENFFTWKNPHASRSDYDLKRILEDNLQTVHTPEGRRMIPIYHSDKLGQQRWAKFWYAVHELDQWVHRRTTIDAVTLEQHIQTYYHTVKHIYKESRTQYDRGARQMYTAARLLEPESKYHMDLFRNYRDGEHEHFRLSDEEKDELMNELLAEKANVVVLFGKVEVLHSSAMTLGSKQWIRQFTTGDMEILDAAAGLLGLKPREAVQHEDRASTAGGAGKSGDGGVGGVGMLLNNLEEVNLA